MLGKLIKYDLLYNWKFFVGTMAVLLCWGAIGIPSYNNGITLTITAVLVPVLLAVVVLCVVFVLRYYNSSLYGRQGYLTMALPTSPANILGAKVITTTIWFNAIIIVGYFSAALYIRSLSDAFDYVFSNLGSFLQNFLYINLSMLSTLLTIYLAITIANVWVNGKRLGALGGIAFYVIWQLLSDLIFRWITHLVVHNDITFMTSFLFGTFFNSMMWLPAVFWSQIVFNLCLIVIAFLLNSWLIQKKVSLQ